MTDKNKDKVNEHREAEMKKEHDESTEKAKSPDNEEKSNDEIHASKEQESQEKDSKSGRKKSKSKGKNKLNTLETKIKDLENNLEEMNDKYLRLFSEFDNYRKRTMKERLELTKNASEEVISDLLPILDDFERAIKSIESQENSEGDAKGIKLIYNKLTNILKRKGLDPMQSIGESFDTDFHEAVTNIPAPEEDLKGKVVDEIEKGYLLNGKVIRFAKVVVGQ